MQMLNRIFRRNPKQRHTRHAALQNADKYTGNSWKWRERVGGSPSVPATTLWVSKVPDGTGFIALTDTNINEITVRF